MTGSRLTSRQLDVLRYLNRAGRGSKKAIRGVTGAGPNTLAGLTGRALIAKSGTQYRLTDSGRERLREEGLA